MKYLKWCLLLTIILLTTGCWNYRELSEISVVGAMGIDYKDNKFNVSVEIINTKQVSNTTASGSKISNEAPFVVYQTSGRTIKEAVTNMVFEASSPLYIGHMNLLIIGEDAARKGLEEFIDYIMADPESRKIFPTLVVKNGKAIDALKILMPLETITSANIKSSLEAIANMNGTISNRLFDEVLMCIYVEGRDPTITSIEVVGNKEEGSKTDNLSYSIPKASIRINGSAAFKGDKLVGFLNEKESLAYTIIRNHAKTISLSFPCDDNGHYGDITIDNTKSKLKVKLVKNKPVAEMTVTGGGALSEINCKIDITNPKNIKKIEKRANKELKKLLNITIKKVQKEFGGDIFGFGERLYKENNKYWEKNKKNWDKIFPNMDYKVIANVKLESIESTVRAAKDE